MDKNTIWRKILSEESPQVEYTINKETRISLGLILIIASTFGGLAWGLNNKLDDIEDQLVDVRTTLLLIDGKFEDHWSATDTKIMLERTARLNPGFEIPDISDLVGDDK